MNLDAKKPHIVYPCEWEYRIIGENEEKLKEMIFEIMPREYCIESGKHSRQGRFVSIYVRIMVDSEVERNEIFSALSKHPLVKMVI